jgi:hypothetical protein
VDKGETIYGVTVAKCISTVIRVPAIEYQEAEARSAVYAEQSSRLSDKARHELEDMLGEKSEDLDKLSWERDF